MYHHFSPENHIYSTVIRCSIGTSVKSSRSGGSKGVKYCRITLSTIVLRYTNRGETYPLLFRSVYDLTNKFWRVQCSPSCLELRSRKIQIANIVKKVIRESYGILFWLVKEFVLVSL